MARQHEVAISVAGQKIGGWTEYSVETGILSPADSFMLTRPVNRDAWNLCRLDAEVTVQIDGVPVVTGYIGTRSAKASAGTMTIGGRCKAGRLVQESAPGIQYTNQTVRALIAQLASPWFPAVSLQGARDRRIRRGRGFKAPAPTEPVVLDGVTPGGRIEPGQMRWSVIEDLATQIGLLVWGAADGKELVVAPPNYRQDVQWQFVHVRGRAGTVLELDLAESIEDGYSLIKVVGSGRGTDADYGTGPADRAGEWRDVAAADGVGGDFLRPKRLVLAQEAVRSADQARRLAERDARRRNQKRRSIAVEAPAHGQVVRGSTPTIYAPNTLARVVYDDVGIDAAYLVTGCRYTAKRDQEQTLLELVPRGTELSL